MEQKWSKKVIYIYVKVYYTLVVVRSLKLIITDILIYFPYMYVNHHTSTRERFVSARGDFRISSAMLIFFINLLFVVQCARLLAAGAWIMAKDPLDSKFVELVEEHGDPLDEIFRIGMDLDEEPNIRLKALETAASYGYAKKKSIEHTISGDPDNPLKFEGGIDLKNINDKDLETLAALLAKAHEPTEP